MLTYLDVVTSNAQTWMKKVRSITSCVLYFHIHNPIVEMKGDDATEAEIEKEIKEI